MTLRYRAIYSGVLTQLSQPVVSCDLFLPCPLVLMLSSTGDNSCIHSEPSGCGLLKVVSMMSGNWFGFYVIFASVLEINR